MNLLSLITHWIVFIEVLPLLVQLPHVHQPVLHLLQSPDLLPFTFTTHLDGRLAQHCITLPREADRKKTAFTCCYSCWPGIQIRT